MLYVLDHLNRSTASKTAFLKGRNSLRSTPATGRLRATSQAAGHISGYNFETKEASILAVSPSPALKSSARLPLQCSIDHAAVTESSIAALAVKV
jgi:hypothetical protein